MDYLPTEEEQDWLIDRLADLIERRGEGHFLNAPVVKPTRKCFPDKWSFSNLGVDRTVRRLMQYAGLSAYDIQIEMFGYNSSEHSIAGAFLGIEDGCCNFALNINIPVDEEIIAGIMSHEVAHAYRSVQKLNLKSSDTEEWATDITAVYLGFGILAANNSYRYKSHGDYNFHYTSVQKIGYLTPQAFAFVFAIQLVARGYSTRECKGLLRYLEPNQAAFTKKALIVVRDRKEEILKRLRIGPRDNNSSSRHLSDILKPLPEFEASEYIAYADLLDRYPPGFNKDNTVFRVRKSRMSLYCGLGLIAGSMSGIVIATIRSELWPAFAISLLGLFVGYCFGRKSGYAQCSHPDCKAILTEDDVCPNCQGCIAGTIRHEDDRLEAMDKLIDKCE